jgi:hypothetical protein
MDEKIGVKEIRWGNVDWVHLAQVEYNGRLL